MAREHMIQGVSEQKKSEQIVPQTKKEKWQNYWYHYKIHTIAAVFLVLVGGYIIFSGMGSKKIDYTVAVISTTDVYPEASALETALERYVGDINGDGEVKISVEVFSLPADQKEDMPQNYALQNLQLTSGFILGEYSLLIMDKCACEEFREYLKAIDIDENIVKGFTTDDNVIWNWSDSALFEQAGNETLGENTYFAVINEETTKESKLEKRQLGEEILVRILTDTPHG